jgi:hypothetical protein
VTRTTAERPTPQLPALDAGVCLLDVEDGATLTPLYALVLDRLLTGERGGRALWVDPGTTDRATALAKLAPDHRVLDRIDVGRGFTPHQHHALVGAAARWASRETPLVVLPRIDARYRSDDCPRGTAERALSGIADRLERLAARLECPVVVTRRGGDDLTAPIEAVAETTLRVVNTIFGPQLRGEGFETTVYPVEGTREVPQTTLAFWARVLERRTRATDGATTAPPTPEVTAGGSQ